MYPELLKIGPITIYSFGLMMGTAFLVGNMIIAAELKRRGKDPTIATNITMLALLGGISGSKLFHLFENWSDFIKDPISMTFSSAGLTWYGGFLLATVFVLLYVRSKKITFIEIADIAAPALALSYGIGRIGCQLAGDGDYGIPTDLPWKMSYVHGTVPTAYTLDPVTSARIPTEWVHPAPLYEFLAAVLIFTFLLLRRKKSLPPGYQFGMFLILHPLSRFFVEFIRINPKLLFGLSEAQLLSIILFIYGLYLLFRKAPVTNPPMKPGKKNSKVISSA